jgi:hypothetical protein
MILVSTMGEVRMIAFLFPAAFSFMPKDMKSKASV